MNVGRSLLHAAGRPPDSQRQLAELAGAPQSTVARIERGTTYPGSDTSEKLLEACGMDIEVAHKRGVGVDVILIRDILELRQPRVVPLYW